MKTVKLLEQVVKCSFGSFIMYFLICLCQVLFTFISLLSRIASVLKGVSEGAHKSVWYVWVSAPRAAPEWDAGILLHLRRLFGV